MGEHSSMLQINKLFFLWYKRELNKLFNTCELLLDILRFFEEQS